MCQKHFIFRVRVIMIINSVVFFKTITSITEFRGVVLVSRVSVGRALNGLRVVLSNLLGDLGGFEVIGVSGNVISVGSLILGWNLWLRI